MQIYTLIYLVVISFVSIIITLRDKNAARKNTWRVKERTLLAVSALGGSAAMLLTMLAVRHKTRRAKFMVGIPLIILVQVAIIGLAFNQSLSVSRYSVETEKINGQLKFVLVTDYHSCDYGDGQCELLNAIDTEQPDAILLCGDIFDDKLPPENAIDFIKGVSVKYPCFYVSGNHEFWSGKADEFKDILTSCGVKVLEGATEVLNVRGDKIRIIGIDDPDTDRYASRSEPYAEQIKRLSVSVDTDIFTILLSHRPERIDELLPLKPDLVLSGHAHGGQWRIPFILENGLISPNQGLFPKYMNGEHFFKDTELIISRGLARESTAVPRVFNRPEIVVITLGGIFESEDTTMIELNFIPHDGVEIQNIGKVRFGQTPEEVEEIFGAPAEKYLSYFQNGYMQFYNPTYVENIPKGATLTDNMRYCYYDYEITVMFGADKKVEAIECNAGPFSEKTRTIIYGTDFFSLSADEAIDLMEKRNNGSIFNENPGRPKKSILYIEIDVGIWRDMDEADVEESIREAIKDGVYEANKDNYDNEMRKAHHFCAVLIGEKGYYRDYLAS